MKFDIYFQTPTPPQMIGSISYGDILAVALVLGIVLLVVIGGVMLYVQLIGGRK
jgi:hypothetical protein